LATYVERFSGVRRTRGATNPSSNCRQKLFSDDDKVELSVWKGAPCSVLVGCNSRLIAGGCDGGGELARPKSGSPKLRKRKRGRKETIAHSLWVWHWVMLCCCSSGSSGGPTTKKCEVHRQPTHRFFHGIEISASLCNNTTHYTLYNRVKCRGKACSVEHI
jgi:hypothetical protein